MCATYHPTLCVQGKGTCLPLLGQSDMEGTWEGEKDRHQSSI